MSQERKRILHIIQSLDNGGCENMLLRTLPLLKSVENEVLVLSKHGDLAESFAQAGIRVHVLSQKNLMDIVAYVRLAKKIKTIKPDLIITYLLHADIVGRIIIQIISKIPVIPFLRTNYNHPRYRLARWFEQLTKVFVKEYLANSEAVKKYYVDAYRIKPEKITVIPNGIDVEKFNKTNSEKEAIGKKLGIGAEKRVIVCVANFSKNKGHEYLLDAFEKVFEKHNDVLLLLVGDGVEKENLMMQTDALKSKQAIYFMGQRRDVNEILAISEIFVLPTLFEGLSNSIMEAMASGLVVITTDIPENRAIITHNVNGVLVDRESVFDLAKNILLLLKDDGVKKILGNESKKSITNRYSLGAVSKVFDKYLISTLK